MNALRTKACKISHAPWGEHNGEDIMFFRMENNNGAFVELTNYGGTLVSVVVPDKTGHLENVILGFSSLEGYVNDRCYIGSTVGRFANRIGNARFTLDGKTYHLDDNDNGNTNHGGFRGFHAKVFDYRVQDNMITFSLSSPDGEGGFPGNVLFSVDYLWNDHNELSIRYRASSDKRTVLNFTNHAYFNLAPDRGNILEHELTVHAEQVLQSTPDCIPTGAIIPAGDKLLRGHRVSERVGTINGKATGLNSYYVLSDGTITRAACVLKEKYSGRVMDVFTTYPGVQVYTGDYLSAVALNNRGEAVKPFDGLCLECQYFPDSPNHDHFPSTVVGPGQHFDEQIVYTFRTEL